MGALVCDVSSGLTPELELKDRLICGSPASHSGRFLRPTERRKPCHDYPLWEHAEQSGVASNSTDPTGLMTGPETGATTTSHVGHGRDGVCCRHKNSDNTLLLSCLHGVAIILNKNWSSGGNSSLGSLFDRSGLHHFGTTVKMRVQPPRTSQVN